MTDCELIPNSNDMLRLRAVKLRKDYISKAYVSPDYLLGEIPQTKESRLSETTTSRVGLPIHLQTGAGIYASTTAGTVATGEVRCYNCIVGLR